MQKEVPLAQQMAESEDQFRNQFDPHSITYHGGSKQAVPVGNEKRIPESMPNMYPEGFDPNQPQPQQEIDYGQQYNGTQKARNALQSLKKSLSKLPPILEAFLRHQQTFKAKGDPNNQKHVKTHQQNMKKQQENLKAIQQQLQKYISELQKGGQEGKFAASELKTLIIDSNKKYSTKETLTDYNFKVKQFSSKCFTDAGKLLQKMKDIKKAYANNKKKQQTSEQKKTQQSAQKSNEK